MPIYDPLAGVHDLLGYGPTAMRTLADVERDMANRGQLPAGSQLGQTQQESLISELTRNTLGPIASVANVLDMPGGMVRDLLAGQNPLWGIGNPEQRATGRELLTKWFGVSKNDPDKWELADIGGFATEVLTDPLTAFTLPFGAASRAGQVAAKAGLMRSFKKVAKSRGLTTTGKKFDLPSRRMAQMRLKPKDLIGGDKKLEAAFFGAGGTEKMLDKPLGGLFGIGMPFKQPKWAPFTGEKSQQFVGQLDKLGEWFRYGKLSPIREAMRLFSSANLGARTKGVQPIAQDIFNAQNLGRTEADAVVADIVSQMQRAGGDVNPADINAVRRFVEKTPVLLSRPAKESMATAVFDARKALEKVLNEMRERGIDIAKLDDVLEFWPRYMSKLPWDKKGAKRGLPMGVAREIDQAREHYLKGINGGTATLMDLFEQSAKDPAFAAAIRNGDIDGVADLIARRFGDRIPDTYPVPVKKKGPLPGSPTRKTGTKLEKGRWRELAKTIVATPEETRAVGLFGNHPIIDLQRKLRTSQDQIAAADGVLEGLTELSQKGVVGKHVVGGTSLGDLFKAIGISADVDNPGGMNRIMKGLGKDVDPVSGLFTKDQYKELLEWRVPQDIAEDFTRISNGASSDLISGPILNAFDSFTSLFKAGVLTRPARYFRDFVSGQYENALSGQFSAGSLLAAGKLLRGGSSSHLQKIPAVKKLLAEQGRANTLENAADATRQLAAAHGMGGKMQQELSGAVGVVPIARNWEDDVLGMAAGGMGGSQPFQVSRVIKKGLGLTEETSWNPLAIRGVGIKRPRVDTRFGLVAAGEDIGAASETLNRLSPFIRNLEKGMDPFEAALKVNAAQVLYSNRALTDFEQGVLLRMFPFYRFMRGKIPHHVKMLWERPGGGLGQTYRAINVARREGTGEQDVIPQYISETAAIPLEAGPSGQPRYVTGFGLMLEDPASFAGILTGDPMGAGIELLSRINPIPKFLIESLFDETLFQRGPRGGRNLEDLDPLLGRFVANIRDTIIGTDPKVATDPVEFGKTVEHALANSPISAWLTMARKGFDPRKEWWIKLINILTGVRVTDVSVGSQEALLRELATKKMQESGGKVFEKAYYPKEAMMKMSQKEYEDALALSALTAELAKKAKLRKIEGQKK